MTPTATTPTDQIIEDPVEALCRQGHDGGSGGDGSDFGRGGGWGGGSGDGPEGEESGRVLWGVIGGILAVTVLAGFNPTVAAVVFLIGLGAVGVGTLSPTARRS